MSFPSSWRSPAALNWTLLGALVTAVFLGSYGIFSPPAAHEASESGAETSSGAEGREGGSSSSGSAAASGQAEDPKAAFTAAAQGSCLNWDVAPDGMPRAFQEVSCDKPHRFEVSARINLGSYPTSEFGSGAGRPDITRQNQLRDELCESPTLKYLNGRWDPAGKFDIASILPPAHSWEQGDRTLLCGLQISDPNGAPKQSTGNVAAVDQAVVAKPGQCVAIGDNGALTAVDCGQPHQLETVSVVNLAEKFPGPYPGVEELDKFLIDTCAAAAEQYLGGEENLYQSTLAPLWGSLSESAWNGGSRSVNCSLMHPAEEGFSTITGSATGGREALTIDGAAPKEQPKRNPRRADVAPAPAAGAPTPGA